MKQYINTGKTQFREYEGLGRKKNLEESKMSDCDRIENEFKKNLKRIKVGNKSPKKKWK